MLTFAFACRLFLALLLSIPSSLTYANGPQSVESLLCTPSGQPLDSQARAALSDLEALLKTASDDTDDTPPEPHCEDCLPPFIAVPASPVALDVPQPVFHKTHAVSGPVYMPSVRGPPLGSRAPPLAV